MAELKAEIKADMTEVIRREVRNIHEAQAQDFKQAKDSLLPRATLASTSGMVFLAADGISTRTNNASRDVPLYAAQIMDGQGPTRSASHTAVAFKYIVATFAQILLNAAICAFAAFAADPALQGFMGGGRGVPLTDRQPIIFYFTFAILGVLGPLSRALYALGSLGWKTIMRKTIQHRIGSAISLMLDTPVFRALMRCSWRMGYRVPDHVRYPELYESYYSPDGPEGVDNRTTTTSVNTRNEFI